MQNIGIMRLASQQVAGTRFKNVTDLVSWMGAMQAQDLNSVKWAVGIRLPSSNEDIIDKAINNGEIIRTHILRPTWHFVAAADYLMIMQLTAPNVRSGLKSRRKQLELDEEYFKKSNPALERVLANGNHLTREELMKELAFTLPNLDSPRMNHILLEAELEGLICSGSLKKKQHSFALRSEILRESRSTFNRDEALYKLAKKYFSSHGPATVSDFNWWSGLSMTDCRKGLEMVKSELAHEPEGAVEYWYKHETAATDSSNDKHSTNKSLFLLPAFDEFIISYRDRSAVLKYEHHEKAVSSNGVFRPVIVLDGQVIGLWNKVIKKDKLKVVADWFISPDKKTKSQIQKAAAEYASFLGLKPEE